MWPQKNLKILVPRTPPDPPGPPLTPPRGPGGPKMAKMHSLKSIDDNLCQKSHFWGVKKIDLFFHSECTIRGAVLVAVQMIQPACYEPGAKDMQGGIAPKSFPYFTLCAQNYINVALALLLKAKG